MKSSTLKHNSLSDQGIQEQLLKKYFPEFNLVYKYSKDFMCVKSPFTYPNIYSTIEKEKLISFMIDFSVSFALFGKRDANDNFYFTVSCTTFDSDFNYPSKIPFNELSFWLPRLIIQNDRFNMNEKYD